MISTWDLTTSRCTSQILITLVFGTWRMRPRGMPCSIHIVPARRHPLICKSLSLPPVSYKYIFTRLMLTQIFIYHHNFYIHTCFSSVRCHNTCVAELFISIFHSFKAGIVNAISSFKCRKMCLFWERKTS